MLTIYVSVWRYSFGKSNTGQIGASVEDNYNPNPRSDSRIRKKPTNKLIGLAALVIAVGLASFFGGIQYQKGQQKTASTNNSFTSNNGQFPSSGGFNGGGPGGRQMGGFGTVTAVNDSSISVQNSRSGSITTYSITSSTTVSDNGSTASVSNIQTGDTVIVQTSSSSSTTATQIIVNPSFNGGPGGISQPSST